jgi:predicted  nucleic acid-binding Zn-ribbon protein
MSHQCVRCNTFYDDGSKELLNGCTKCGGKFFFFVRKEHIKEAEKLSESLSLSDKKQIEKDVFSMLGVESPEKAVVLDLESIRILKPGKYELDLVKLLQKYPLIYRFDEGKYIIDLEETFKEGKDLEKEKKEVKYA